jgi:integrase
MKMSALTPAWREREEEGRRRWLTPEDANLEFTLFPGLRRGEVLDVTWERVDRARGVIVRRAAIGW